MLINYSQDFKRVRFPADGTAFFLDALPTEVLDNVLNFLIPSSYIRIGLLENYFVIVVIL